MPAPVHRGGAALVIALLALLAVSHTRAQGQSVDTSRGLAIGYTDGRTIVRALKASGGMWTPYFPRAVGSKPSRDGLPLTTLHIRHVVDGNDVVVTVLLSYGGPWRDPIEVATVRVSPGNAPVHVTELRAHGVDAITLAVVSIPHTPSYVPEAVSVSAQVDVRVEPVNGSTAAYRAIITNNARVPLMWAQLDGSRGGKPVSMRPRGKRNRPLATPGGEHAVDISVGSVSTGAEDSPGRWLPLDRLSITAVLWQDGLVEGDPAAAASQASYDAARAARLDAMISALRAATPESAGDIRSVIREFRGADPETQEAGDALLADVDAFVRSDRSVEGLAFDAWRNRALLELTEWRERIVIPKL
jgi:hypothetical protein